MANMGEQPAMAFMNYCIFTFSNSPHFLLRQNISVRFIVNSFIVTIIVSFIVTIDYINA